MEPSVRQSLNYYKSAIRSIREGHSVSSLNLDENMDGFLINQMSLRFKAVSGRFLNKKSLRKLTKEKTSPRFLNQSNSSLRPNETQHPQYSSIRENQVPSDLRSSPLIFQHKTPEEPASQRIDSYSVKADIQDVDEGAKQYNEYHKTLSSLVAGVDRSRLINFQKLPEVAEKHHTINRMSQLQANNER